MSKLYTVEQADELIRFYSDKVIGKSLEKSKRFIIDHLEKELILNNQYDVVAVSKLSPEFAVARRRIHSVAKDLNLPLPVQVLQANPNSTP